MANYNLTVSNNSINITTSSPGHAVTLSRTGGQGSKGDSISNVYVTDGVLYVEISNSAGNVVDTVNVGDFETLITEFAPPIGGLSDVEDTATQDGELVVFDSAGHSWVTRKATTDDISDIDNTNKADGAVFVYDGTISKYKATTAVIGGTF